MTTNESPGQLKYKKYLKPALEARCVKDLKAKGFKITHPKGLPLPTYTPVSQRKNKKATKKPVSVKKAKKAEKAKKPASLESMFGF